MHQAILEFWFEELKPANWWEKNPRLDDTIRQRFGELHRRAAGGELWHWRSSAEGRLAEIIILDQFSRNRTATGPRPLLRTAWRWCWRRRRSASGWMKSCR